MSALIFQLDGSRALRLFAGICAIVVLTFFTGTLVGYSLQPTYASSAAPNVEPAQSGSGAVRNVSLTEPCLTAPPSEPRPSAIALMQEPGWADGLPSTLEDGDPNAGTVDLPAPDGATLVVDGITLRQVYTVQVGVYRDAGYARAMTALLEERGYDPFTMTAVRDDGMLLRHVRIADFDDRQQALAAAADFIDRENLAAAVVATRHARQ